MSGELRSAQPHDPWEASVILSCGQGRVDSPRIFAGGAGVSADSEDMGYSLHFMSILHLKGMTQTNQTSFLFYRGQKHAPFLGHFLCFLGCGQQGVKRGENSCRGRAVMTVTISAAWSMSTRAREFRGFFVQTMFSAVVSLLSLEIVKHFTGECTFIMFYM